MTTNIHHLKHRSQFRRVAKTQLKYVAPSLIVQTMKRRDNHNNKLLEDDIRIGFTVSKKVGNAVHRNRTRRRLKAVAREILPTHGKKGHDLVLIGRVKTRKLPYSTLVSDLKLALGKLYLYNG